MDGRQGKQATWQLSGKSERHILSHSFHCWMPWPLILSLRGFLPSGQQHITTHPPAAAFTSDSCSKDFFKKHRCGFGRFVTLASLSAQGLRAGEMSVRHRLQVLQQMLHQYWDFGESLVPWAIPWLTARWLLCRHGFCSCSRPRNDTVKSTSLVAEDKPLHCLQEEDIYAQSSCGKAVDHCQFTLCLWTFIPCATES